jgi:hypothetical protein
MSLQVKFENIIFCYGKDGGQGYVNKSECSCTSENPCQEMIDANRYIEAFKDIRYGDVEARDEMIKKLKPEFKDSKWWENNVIK